MSGTQQLLQPTNQQNNGIYKPSYTEGDDIVGGGSFESNTRVMNEAKVRTTSNQIPKNMINFKGS